MLDSFNPTLLAARQLQAGSLPPSSAAPGTQEAAQDFEAVFLSQMLQHMFASAPAGDELTGGGSAMETWRGLLVDEYGKMMAKHGGIGMSDAVAREMIHLQENAR